MARAASLQNPIGKPVRNIFMVQAWGYGPSFDGPAWSISSEWAAYLLFPLLIVPTLFLKPVVSSVCAFFSIAIHIYFKTVPARLLHNAQPDAVLDLHDLWEAIPVLRCVVEFTLGLITYRLAATPFALRVGGKSFLTMGIAILAIALLAIPRSDFFVLLMPFLLTSLASGDHRLNRLLSSEPAEYLRILSYSIYLVHDLLGGLIAWLHQQTARMMAEKMRWRVYIIAVFFLLGCGAL